MIFSFTSWQHFFTTYLQLNNLKETAQQLKGNSVLEIFVEKFAKHLLYID